MIGRKCVVVLVIFFLAAMAQAGIVLREYKGLEGKLEVKDPIKIGGCTTFSLDLYPTEKQTKTINVTNLAREGKPYYGSDLYLEIRVTVSFNDGSGEVPQTLFPKYTNYTNATGIYIGVDFVNYTINNTGVFLKLDPKYKVDGSLSTQKGWDHDRNNNTFLEIKTPCQQSDGKSRVREIELTLGPGVGSKLGKYTIKIDFLLLDT